MIFVDKNRCPLEELPPQNRCLPIGGHLGLVVVQTDEFHPYVRVSSRY
jgi:hypothetical protein